MKTTSRPSSRTPLNATVNAYQSRPARSLAARCRGLLALRAEGLVLVVQRLVAARAQDRLAQPLQPEREQQRADDEAKRLDRDRAERRPERRHENARGRPAAAAAPISGERQPRTTPTPSTIVSASTISTALARNAPATTRIVPGAHEAAAVVIAFAGVSESNARSRVVFSRTYGLRCVRIISNASSAG